MVLHGVVKDCPKYWEYAGIHLAVLMQGLLHKGEYSKTITQFTFINILVMIHNHTDNAKSDS